MEFGYPPCLAGQIPGSSISSPLRCVARARVPAAGKAVGTAWSGGGPGLRGSGGVDAVPFFRSPGSVRGAWSGTEAAQ